MSRRRSTPLTRATWAEAALDALVVDGPGAVAVEPIARKLGVTKGSFYHHFGTREDLLVAALERWETLGTSLLVAQGFGPDPAARLEQLFLAAMASATDPRGRLLVHLAAHADDPAIGPVLQRVTSRRLDFLRDVWVAAGAPPDEAMRRALLAYSAYLGLIQLVASAPDRVPQGDGLRDYVRSVVRMLVRS